MRRVVWITISLGLAAAGVAGTVAGLWWNARVPEGEECRLVQLDRAAETVVFSPYRGERKPLDAHGRARLVACLRRVVAAGLPHKEGCLCSCWMQAEFRSPGEEPRSLILFSHWFSFGGRHFEYPEGVDDELTAIAVAAGCDS
jgi:hypothetical protein